MTTVDYYPPRDVLLDALKEDSATAESMLSRYGSYEVTPEEEEAWVEKLHRMAGTHE